MPGGIRIGKGMPIMPDMAAWFCCINICICCKFIIPIGVALSLLAEALAAALLASLLVAICVSNAGFVEELSTVLVDEAEKSEPGGNNADPEGVSDGGVDEDEDEDEEGCPSGAVTFASDDTDEKAPDDGFFAKGSCILMPFGICKPAITGTAPESPVFPLAAFFAPELGAAVFLVPPAPLIIPDIIPGIIPIRWGGIKPIIGIPIIPGFMLGAPVTFPFPFPFLPFFIFGIQSGVSGIIARIGKRPLLAAFLADEIFLLRGNDPRKLC